MRRLPYDMERELYFTLREVILNAVRHARATELHLRLTQSSTGYQATLRDNGVGFSLYSAEGSGHYGLKGMRERIRKIGGELTIATAPGEGTEISIAFHSDRNDREPSDIQLFQVMRASTFRFSPVTRK